MPHACLRYRREWIVSLARRAADVHFLYAPSPCDQLDQFFGDAAAGDDAESVAGASGKHGEPIAPDGRFAISAARQDAVDLRNIAQRIKRSERILQAVEGAMERGTRVRRRRQHVRDVLPAETGRVP